MLTGICGLKGLLAPLLNILICVSCRQADLEMVSSVLQQYRDSHSGLIRWIEETTEKQENTQPEQTDSKSLSEQLAQQTVGHSFRDVFLAGMFFIMTDFSVYLSRLWWLRLNRTKRNWMSARRTLNTTALLLR